MMDKTHLKIVKLWRKGNHSSASIARKIGRPGSEGMQRVKDALIREKILHKTKNNKVRMIDLIFIIIIMTCYLFLVIKIIRNPRYYEWKTKSKIKADYIYNQIILKEKIRGLR